MQKQRDLFDPRPAFTPWNKGKLIGAKPPLRPNTSGRSAPSSRLRGASATWLCSISRSTAGCAAAMSCGIKVEDVAPRRYALDRATVRQKKTGQPVKL